MVMIMDMKLGDEDFVVTVRRKRDMRKLSITCSNWEEIKAEIELSVYQSQLKEIGLRPDYDVDPQKINEVWMP